MNWIACSDKLPELVLVEDGSMRESARVLVYGYAYGSPEHRRTHGLSPYESDLERVIVVAKLSDIGDKTSPQWTDEYGDLWWELEAVTHWMSLPEPPK